MVAAQKLFPLSLERSKTLFFFLLLLCGSTLISPGIALLIGSAFALTQTHPFAAESRRTAKLLLQVSVVAIGFGMDARVVLRAGRSGVLYTAIGITFALSLGLLLGRSLRVRRNTSMLIAAGTAICGGSAIAALAPVLGADAEETGISMATVFLLNAVALWLFPAIGHAVHLSQTQFGLWAALAIHDTSSVVGATEHYGPAALAVGTAVKLARALWIVPVSLAAGLLLRRDKSQPGNGRITIPWFIFFFCAAAALNTLLPAWHTAFRPLVDLGHAGLSATLFLIGTELSRNALSRLGTRPLLQAVTLWIAVGSVSLFAILRGLIAF
jgi:uncharacterized integral membrane protein (TIGR00698 family)